MWTSVIKAARQQYPELSVKIPFKERKAVFQFFPQKLKKNVNKNRKNVHLSLQYQENSR